MVVPTASLYEVDVANRLCINPYEPLPTVTIAPYVDPGQS